MLQHNSSFRGIAQEPILIRSIINKSTKVENCYNYYNIRFFQYLVAFHKSIHHSVMVIH